MAEYIDREKLIKSIKNDCLEQVFYTKENAIDCIKAAPEEDVEPVTHGYWIEQADIVYDHLYEIPPYLMVCGYKCSVCGRYEKKIEPYCNCGAKMDLEVKQ